jgi:hypothetical protein
MEPPPPVSQLPVLIKEWMTTEDELRVLSAEIREKRKRSKAVKDMITKIMKGNKVGQLNISAGQVVQRTKTTKQPLSKKVLMGSLTDFFKGDKSMAEKCIEFIESRRPVKEVDSLTLDPAGSPGSQ